MRRRAPHRIDPMGGLRAAHFFLVLEPADSPRVAGAPGRPSTEPRARRCPHKRRGRCLHPALRRKARLSFCLRLFDSAFIGNESVRCSVGRGRSDRPLVSRQPRASVGGHLAESPAQKHVLVDSDGWPRVAECSCAKPNQQLCEPGRLAHDRCPHRPVAAHQGARGQRRAAPARPGADRLDSDRAPRRVVSRDGCGVVVHSADQRCGVVRRGAVDTRCVSHHEDACDEVDRVRGAGCERRLGADPDRQPPESGPLATLEGVVRPVRVAHAATRRAANGGACRTHRVRFSPCVGTSPRRRETHAARPPAFRRCCWRP